MLASGAVAPLDAHLRVTVMDKSMRPPQQSLRAQRSNPESLRGGRLDCFAALAMTAYETTVSFVQFAFE